MLPATISVFPPSKDLHWLVESYQWVRVDLALPPDFTERVVPTPRYSFVFQLGDVYEGSHARRREFRRFPPGLIATPVEYPVTVRPTGHTVGLRVAMRPHTLELVLRTAGENVRNFVPDIRDVLGRPAEDMLERMREAFSPETCIAIFEDWLRERVDDNRARRVAEMGYAMDRLAATAGRIRIGDLANEMAISERQLTRWFHRSVGLAPKFFQRVVRLNGVLDQVRDRFDADWADLAFQYGFSDQPHLVREFVQLAGEPPTSYLRNVRLMREVFQQSLVTHVLNDESLRESLPQRLIGHLVSARLAAIRNGEPASDEHTLYPTC